MLRKFLAKLALILIAISFLGESAFAEPFTLAEARATGNGVNAFDAGQVDQRLNTTTPNFLDRGQPNIHRPPPPSQPLPQGDKIKLKLNYVTFSDNKVYSDKQLLIIFSPYLHKTITLNELQGLVDQVTALYRSTGYVLSQAILPPQTIKDGLVKVQIIEGYISKVKVAGKPGLNAFFYKKYGHDVFRSRPLQLAILEHDMLLANDLPGANVRAVITPSTTTPGAADLTLYATRKLLNAFVAYDNYGTRYLGPQEISYGFAFNSIFLPGESHDFHFTTTSQHKELQYAEYVHTQFLGSKGLNFTLGANYTETRPGFVLINADIIGRSTSIYSNWTYPLIRSRDKNLNVHALANYQNVNATILGGPFYQDRFRSLTFGGSFNGDDRWRGFNTLSLDAGHGFNIWGAAPHFYQSRPKGRSAYTLADLTASRLQVLSQRFSFYVSTSAQYSWNALLATEQFGFGGPTMGRGYDPYELAGDRGLAGKAELRFQLAPGFNYLRAVQVYIFYDAGEIWNIDDISLPGQLSAASTGGGLRVNFIKNVDGEFFIGKPLTKAVSALVAMNSNGHQARSFFQLVARI